MKTDWIYFAALCFAQLLLFSPLLGSFYPDFLAAYNFVVWAVVCGIAYAAYPWVRAQSSGPAGLRLLPILARAAAIFIVSTAVSVFIIGCIAADHFSEWQLGLFFVAVPSAAASMVALLISYGVFQLNRNG